MRRRDFIGWMGGVAAAGLVAGCVPRYGRASAEAASGFDAYGRARRFLTTRCGRIAYAERGRGPAALFLHGFPVNGYQWRGALDRLAPHRRCIAPDFLGLGFTDVAEGQSVAPDAQVAMLLALLDRLEVAAVDLVANDSGGAIAQLLLVRHPERVRSVLLTNCDTEPDSPPAAMAGVLEDAHEGLFPERWLAPSFRDKAFARSPKGLGGATFSFPDRLADTTIDCYLGPLVSSARGRALANAYALGLERNPLAGIEPGLRASTAPVRILWGTADAVFAPTSPSYLDGVLGNSRGVRLLDGAKLFFPEEFPEVLAEEARRLWSVG